MKDLLDHEGRRVRLSAERRAHILGHPEMTGMIGGVTETLRSPEWVVRSSSDERVRLYYRTYFGTAVGDKYLCVVVKLDARDAFVVTAYLTDAVKKGERLWPRKT